MNTPAHILIQAIQSCDPVQLAQAIATLQAQVAEQAKTLPPEDQAWACERNNPVRCTMPNMAGLTPLHVAAKAYATHTHRPALADAFDAMVGMLLEAGASPWAAVGAQGRELGQTVVQVCEGKVPATLQDWLAANINDRGDNDREGEFRDEVLHPIGRNKSGHNDMAIHSTTKAREAREAAARKRNNNGIEAMRKARAARRSEVEEATYA